MSQRKCTVCLCVDIPWIHLSCEAFRYHPKRSVDAVCGPQDGDETFNRAKLLNIGYVEALKEYDYDCFVFSDVDLIPMDDRNTYRCFSQPRHLSVSMDKFGFR